MSEHLNDLSQFAGLKISKAVLDGLHDGIILADTTGRILYRNPAAQAFSEATLFSKDETGATLPDDELPLQKALRQETVNSELLFVRSAQHGPGIWAEVTALPFEGGAVVYYRNVTDRLHAERAREQAKAAAQLQSRFRLLLETAPDGILEVDGEGRLVMINAAVENIFGYKREELLGQNVDILIPAAMRGGHKKHRESYNHHPQTRPMGIGMELLACRKDGSEFSVEVSLSPVPSSEGHHVTAIIRDVTERKRISERMRALEIQFTRELEEKNKQLELRNLEVERANRLKSEFLASVSHELRSPLHTIIGFADLLQEQVTGPLNEKQKRFVGNIHNDSEHLLAIINDLLDISKIEAGRMELRIESIDAVPVAEEVIANLRPQTSQKHIVIETHLRSNTLIQADPVRFKQIIYNLVSNAVKFTGEQGRIAIASERQGSRLQVTVSDNGVGIAPEDHEAIFDKFFQTGSTTRGVREGTGLGLAITRNLVDRMGGHIWVESAPGHGSRFIFTMPLAPDPGHALLNPAREQPIILLAEGEQRTGDLLLNYLENAGYAVVRAASLTKSLQLAKEIKPNAVILDLLRPDAAGWRVLRELKLQPETANIPVIVASVLDDDDDSRSLGAAAYLTKPVSKKLLLDTLRRLALDTGAEPGPVMVVDDELAARDLLREILLSNGHKALLACNGREALEQLRTVKPCAIVLDLLMPEMDGLTFLFAMKRNPQWATIPVIVLTGKELSANDIQLLKQTSTAILLKGTSWKQQLLEALRRTIAESHV